MFALKAFTIASLVLAGVQAFDVSTPTGVTQCGEAPITISGATGQYHVSILPATNPCDADALFESDPVTDGSYTWKANVPAGTEVVIVVDDDAGNEAWSGPFTVGTGDTSCLNAPSSSSADSSAPSTSSPVNDAYTYTAAPAPATHTSLSINSVSTSAPSTPPFGAPINAQGNTGAAFSNARASTFTVLAAMGVVAMAL